MKLFRILAVVVVIAAAGVAVSFRGLAQAPAPAAAAAIRSPEVHPDRSITFRVQAPQAGTVSLRFEGNAQMHPMKKDPAGFWSVTIGPVEPEIYSYNFVVDGLRVLDLANNTVSSGLALGSNLVEVPGTPARFDEVQNVSHGSINIHSYRSAVQNTTRGLYVYVPAEYYTAAAKRYPVLYLYHGGGGYEADWVRNGRAGVIIDNLLAAKRAVPMIVVMPNNNNLIGSGPIAGPNPTANSNATVIGRELLTEIIPFVESHYRVLPDRESRAIAGLSAGGGTAFPTGLRNLDTFATVGEFSSGMFGQGAVATTPPVRADQIVPGLYDNVPATVRRLKLLYMSCGTEDPRMPFQELTYEDLKKRGFNPVFVKFSGAHQWKVWRHSLHDFAPRLFR